MRTIISTRGGEAPALATHSLHDPSADHPQAQVLADTLDQATGPVLADGKSRTREVHELDDRGHYL